MTLFFVDNELGFDLFVVVFRSDLFVELVPFLFILYILFDFSFSGGRILNDKR